MLPNGWERSAVSCRLAPFSIADAVGDPVTAAKRIDEHGSAVEYFMEACHADVQRTPETLLTLLHDQGHCRDQDVAAIKGVRFEVRHGLTIPIVDVFAGGQVCWSGTHMEIFLKVVD